MSDVVNYNGKPYRTAWGRVTHAHEAGGYTMEGPPELLEINGRSYLRVHIVTSTGQHFYGTKEIKWTKSGGGFDTPLERAETGAMSRALGFAGFGDVEDDESRDDPQNDEASSPRHRQPPATPSTIEGGRDPKGKPSPQIMQRIMKACATLGIDPPTAEQVPTQAEAEARLELYTAEWKRQANLATVPVLPA